MANSVDPEQTAPLGAVCSGSALFASILNSSVFDSLRPINNLSVKQGRVLNQY